MTYVEFPFDRIVDVHWKKKDGGDVPPPPCQMLDFTCDDSPLIICPSYFPYGSWDWFFWQYAGVVLEIPPGSGHREPIPEVIYYQGGRPDLTAPIDPTTTRAIQCCKSLTISLDISVLNAFYADYPYVERWIGCWLRPNISPQSFEKIWNYQQFPSGSVELYSPKYAPTFFSINQPVLSVTIPLTKEELDSAYSHYSIAADKDVSGMTIQWAIGANTALEEGLYPWTGHEAPSSTRAGTPQMPPRPRNRLIDFGIPPDAQATPTDGSCTSGGFYTVKADCAPR